MEKVFLVVEPNDAAATASSASIQRASPGATILRSASGFGALALLAQERIIPSMVFAEYELGDLAGLELLSEMRQVRWLERPAFAFLSETVADRTMVHACRLGACAFLVKPAAVHEVREVIRDFARPARRLAAAGVIQPERGPLSEDIGRAA